MNIENRPHSKIFISMGIQVIPIYVEDTVDVIESQLKNNNQLDFLNFNTAMQRDNPDLNWTPTCRHEITYAEWHVRKNQIRGYLKILSPKKAAHLNAEGWYETKEEELLKHDY